MGLELTETGKRHTMDVGLSTAILIVYTGQNNLEYIIKILIWVWQH